MGSRRFLTPIAALLALPLLLSSVPARGVSVYLHRTVQAGTEVLRLGDLAAIAAADPREAERLRLLPLWRPSVNPEIVPAELIRSKLAGVVEGQAAVVGSHALVLPASVTGQTELRLYVSLLEAVASLPGTAAGRLEVEILSPLDLLGVSGSRAADAFPGDSPPGLVVEVSLSGPVSARGQANGYLGGVYQATCRLIMARSGGAAAAPQQRSFGVRVRQYLPVFVAARDLAAGSVLDRDALELAEQDVAEISGGFLTAADRPEAFRTTAPLSRGERIDPARMLRNYLVRAGDAVAVVFVRPGLRVSVPGRAFASGAAGDRVEVRARGGSRRFTGTVVPSGEVIVDELM
jgi:flagella basal body P-ring formation protein FlgA